MSAMTERMVNESKHFLDGTQHLIDHLQSITQRLGNVRTALTTICESVADARNAANKELSGGKE